MLMEDVLCKFSKPGKQLLDTFAEAVSISKAFLLLDQPGESLYVTRILISAEVLAMRCGGLPFSDADRQL